MVAAAAAERRDVVEVLGRGAAEGARPADDVRGTHRLQPATAGSGRLADRAPRACADQGSAPYARSQSHPSSSTGSGFCSARSTAMASAITASMFERGFGLSIRHPRRLCRATASLACRANSSSAGRRILFSCAAWMLGLVDESPDKLAIVKMPPHEDDDDLDQLQELFSAAYELAKQERPDLSVKLLHSFDTRNGMPHPRVAVAIHEHCWVGGQCVNGCPDKLREG